MFSSCDETVGESSTGDASPCVCLPISLFDLIASPLSLLLHFIPLCGAFVVLVLALSSYLGLKINLNVVLHCLYMYMVAFLALRVLYVVVLVYFTFASWFFPPESLPGDDVLYRLLPRPLPSVCFLPCLFALFCFVLFSDRVRPRFVLV